MVKEEKKTLRRNNINKSLTEEEQHRRKKNATDRNIPKLYDLSIAINKRLVELNVNQEWLADTTKIGKASISAYCNAESMPNCVNLISLSNALETTPDYLLGFSDSASRDIDIKSIHEKTGLSDRSIENLESHCCVYNDCETGVSGTSIALNMLLEQEDFMHLLASIGFHFVEAENKEYYVMEQQKLGKDCYSLNMSEIENLMKCESITLNPLQYFFYSNNEIKEKFSRIVNNIIDTHVSSVEIEKAVTDRRTAWDCQQAEAKKDFDLIDE